jgi:CheY-like chemotaxis protein
MFIIGADSKNRTTDMAHNNIESAPILVIDDEPFIRMNLRDILNFAGYQVKVASGGDEGLEVLRSGTTPQLIISDLYMDGMDGHEFLAAVREEQKWDAIPFVFLSGKDDLRDSYERLRTSNVRGFVAKPYTIDELLTTVQEALAG